jgi:hypothetical protein
VPLSQRGPGCSRGARFNHFSQMLALLADLRSRRDWTDRQRVREAGARADLSVSPRPHASVALPFDGGRSVVLPNW